MLQQLAPYHRKLETLKQAGRLRALSTGGGLDFTSNDYLGLARSPRLTACIATALERGVPAGASGSRLLRGNHAEHERLEAEAATFFGAERALYFGGGYIANLALLSTLPQPGDLVVHDALIHASARSGLKLGRAGSIAVPHNDVDAFDDAIRAWRKAGGSGTPWIVVESLYSMDGDTAPLQDLAALADHYEGILFIDEAHATGVYGPDGRGLSADLEGRQNIVVLHTCGKALGSSGALITGSKVLCDYLINRAKPFIYATAPSPLQATCVREALKILIEEPERQRQLASLTAIAHEKFLDLLGTSSGTHIQPVVIGDNGRTMMIAEHLQQKGFDVCAIRPPTVPPETARLRVSITLNVNADDIRALFEPLHAILADQKP